MWLQNVYRHCTLGEYHGKANWRHGDARDHEKTGERMLGPTIRVPIVIGVNRGSSGHGGIDPGPLHEDLKALR